MHAYGTHKIRFSGKHILELYWGKTHMYVLELYCWKTHMYWNCTGGKHICTGTVLGENTYSVYWNCTVRKHMYILELYLGKTHVQELYWGMCHPTNTLSKGALVTIIKLIFP